MFGKCYLNVSRWHKFVTCEKANHKLILDEKIIYIYNVEILLEFYCQRGIGGSIANLGIPETQIKGHLITNVIIPGNALKNLSLTKTPVLLCVKEIGNDGQDILESCYDLKKYKFITLPAAVEKFEVVKNDTNWIIKEYYSNYFVLRILDQDNPSKISIVKDYTPESLEVKYGLEYDYGLILLSSRSNLYTAFVDYDSACQLIKQAQTCNIHEDGIFYNNLYLFPFGPGIDEGFDAQFHFATNSQGYYVFNTFSYALPRITTFIKSYPDAKAVITAKLRIDLKGDTDSALMFNFKNPTKQINLNISSYEESILEQKSEGIELHTRKSDRSPEWITLTYPGCLISYLVIKNYKPQTFNKFYGGARFYIGKPFIDTCPSRQT